MYTPKLSQLIYIFIMCAFSTNLFAQTPCSGGLADGYPCSNIDLLTHLSLADLGAGAGIEGNDIWGWTHPSTDREYALVGLSNGVSFIDITDPTATINIGFLPSHSNPASTWRDIKVANDHAYIVSERSGHGVQIFDLDRLDVIPSSPITFDEDGWINLPSTSDRAHNIVALPEKNLIYPVGTSGTCSGGITAYDVSDPVNPTWVDCFSSDGYSHDAVCFIYRGPDTDYTGREICIGFNEDTFTIIDMENQTIIKRQTYPGDFYTHQGWITDDQKYVLFDDELDESNTGDPTKTYIWDISDLDNPVSKYVYESSENAIDHNQYVKGPYVYQSNYRAGLRILDISDLDNTAPTEVAYFDIYPSSNSANFNGAWSVYPYFNSGSVLINGIEQGLFVVNPQLPHNVISMEGTGVDTICPSEDAVFTINNDAFAGVTNSDNLTISGLPAGAVATFGTNPLPINSATTLTISGTAGLADGNYSFMVTGTETPVNRISLSFVVTGEVPGASTPLLPTNDENVDDQLVSFSWTPAADATNYDIEISLDPLFGTIDYTISNIVGTSTTYEFTENNINIFWRVVAKNDCPQTTSSVVYRFRLNEEPLPVELVKLKASPSNQAIILDWQTASEIGNEGFELERTIDPSGLGFEKISWITSLNGNTNSLQNYSYTDKEVEEGINYYYRLRQIDTDGKFSISPIVSASLEGRSLEIIAFPNPARDQLSLQLNAANYFRGNAVLAIYDLTGKLLSDQTIEISELTTPYSLNINHLPKGTYVLKICNEQLNLPLRFVKL